MSTEFFIPAGMTAKDLIEAENPTLQTGKIPLSAYAPPGDAEATEAELQAVLEKANY